jgi:hypothetical protein
MGNRATSILPCANAAQARHQQMLACARLRSFLWNHGSRLTIAMLLAWIGCARLNPTHACPPDHLCVPNEVGGSPSTATPYIEYSEVTSTAAVYRVSSLLKTVRSPYQLIQVYESLFFGKILTIDGALMITERDEPNYHESLVHTTLAYLPHARRVLVIGGGDGGTVTQLVKHPNLVEIVWVEIDEQVIEFAVRADRPHLVPRYRATVLSASRRAVRVGGHVHVLHVLHVLHVCVYVCTCTRVRVRARACTKR